MEMEVGEVALINDVPFEAISVTDGLIELQQTGKAKQVYLRSIQEQFKKDQAEERARTMGDINSVINSVGFTCYEIDAFDPAEEGDLMEVTAYVGVNYEAISTSKIQIKLNKKGYWVTFAE